MQPPPLISTANILITNPQSYERAMAQGKPVSASYSASILSPLPPTPASSEYMYDQAPVYQDYFTNTNSVYQNYQQPHHQHQHQHQQPQQPLHHPLFPNDQHYTSPYQLPSPVSYPEVSNPLALFSNPPDQYNYIPQTPSSSTHQHSPKVYENLGPVTNTDHPDWQYKYRELIRHYQDHILSLIVLNPGTESLWHDYSAMLASKHAFLAFSICAFASLHMDYCNLQQQPARHFEPSELSMNLYDQALAQCGAECTNVNQGNYEAAYFATYLIWLCSYRLGHIPFYSDAPYKTDVFSLGKGPISLLTSMKAYLPHSPLNLEWLSYSEGLGNSINTSSNNIPIKVVDSLLALNQILTLNGDLVHKPDHALSLIRDDTFVSGAALAAVPLATPKATYFSALTTLRTCIQKTLSTPSGNYRNLYEWSMTVDASFLNLLKKRRPFALVVVAHYLAMLLFHSKPDLFWLHDRLLHEIKLIITDQQRSEWMAFMKWPTMVVQTVEARQNSNGPLPLGIEMLKQMIQYTL